MSVVLSVVWDRYISVRPTACVDAPSPNTPMASASGAMPAAVAEGAMTALNLSGVEAAEGVPSQEVERH